MYSYFYLMGYYSYIIIISFNTQNAQIWPVGVQMAPVCFHMFHHSITSK